MSAVADAAHVGSGRRVLISGSTGLLGRTIAASLRAAGDEVVPLVRRPGIAGSIFWKPEDGGLDPALVSGFDAVIQLAGEPVAGGRWTPERKRRIWDSRVKGVETLVAALGQARQPPRVFLCASGINFYGDRGDTLLDETMPAGKGFLPDLCVAGEGAAATLSAVSRVVNLRIGVVLAGDGGILPSMLPIFRLGLGGPVGGGAAYLSWISLPDLVRATEHILRADDLRGPLNLVSPEPVTGKAFACALGAALGRPAVLPVPAWLARTLIGEMAQETILSSVRAVPKRLNESGFRFRDTDLAEALAGCGLGKR